MDVLSQSCAMMAFLLFSLREGYFIKCLGKRHVLTLGKLWWDISKRDYGVSEVILQVNS